MASLSSEFESMDIEYSFCAYGRGKQPLHNSSLNIKYKIKIDSKKSRRDTMLDMIMYVCMIK